MESKGIVREQLKKEIWADYKHGNSITEIATRLHLTNEVVRKLAAEARAEAPNGHLFIDPSCAVTYCGGDDIGQSVTKASYDKYFDNPRPASGRYPWGTMFGPSALTPVKVIANGPATIFFWPDDTKTVVKCSAKDQWDLGNAYANAVMKRIFGSGTWVKKAEKVFVDQDYLEKKKTEPKVRYSYDDQKQQITIGLEDANRDLLNHLKSVLNHYAGGDKNA